MSWRRKSRYGAFVAVVAIVAAGCGEAPSDQVGTSRVEQESLPAETLYVADPNGESLTSRIIRLDVQSKRVDRSFVAGYDPTMTLSPDGTTLYVASAKRAGKGGLDDVLAVVDATTGDIRARVPVEDRWEGGAVTTHQTMVTSPDGLWLYVLQARLTGGQGAAYSVATFDTTRGEFLPETVGIDACGAGYLLPSSHDGGRRLQIACPITHDVRIVEVGSDGSAESSHTVSLPTVEDNRTDSNRTPLELWRLSSAVLSGSGNELYAITQSGHVSTVDLSSFQVTRTADLRLSADEFLPIGHAAVAPNGRLFVGTGPLISPSGAIDRLSATRVLIVDTANWTPDGTAAPAGAFEALAASTSGEMVYMVDSERQSVTAVDTGDFSERWVVNGVGTTPTRAEAAPSVTP